MTLKRHTPPHFNYQTGVYYAWLGGSCDYAREERAGGGAYILERDGEKIDTHTVSELHTTEFRMLLTLMVHAMTTLPENSDIVFISNVAYLQNFDRTPDGNSANGDLILECIRCKNRHSSVKVKIVTYHKYPQLPATHVMAHDEMVKLI